MIIITPDSDHFCSIRTGAGMTCMIPIVVIGRSNAIIIIKDSSGSMALAIMAIAAIITAVAVMIRAMTSMRGTMGVAATSARIMTTMMIPPPPIMQAAFRMTITTLVTDIRASSA